MSEVLSMKITSWNVKNSRLLIGASLNSHNTERRRRVRETIEQIGPDILCISEGPPGEEGIISFAEDVLGGQ